MKKFQKLWTGLNKFYVELSNKFYDRLDRKLIESAKSFLGAHGRTVGHQVTFSVLNPTAVAVFSAGLVVGEKSWKTKLFGKRVIWYGDLNLSHDLDSLVGLSRLAGDTLFVLNRNHGDVCRIRSVGNENEIKIDNQDVEQDPDGRYCYKVDAAKERNLEYAKDILTQRGWLPGHLLEFYGLAAPKQVKRAKKAKKKAAKAKNRAKKRA